MSAEEYSAILGRLDGLERQVRWRSVERLLTLAVIGWLLTSGPASPSLGECWQSLRLRCTTVNLRAALDWSLAGVRDLATVRPALDPKTVVEDERESSQESARPMFPRAEAAAVVDPTAKPEPFAVRQQLSSGIPRSPISAFALSSASSNARPATGSDAVRNFASRQSPSARRDSPAPAPSVPSVTSSQSQPDLGASIREAERTLARAFESAPKVAEIGSGLPPLATKTGNGIGFDRSVPATLPAMQDLGLRPAPDSQLTPAQPASAPNGATALAPVAAPPTVALNALGYAQSADGAQAILTDGTTLYVVNEGEVFADRFRVTGISPQGLDVEDRRTNTTFRLQFGH